MDTVDLAGVLCWCLMTVAFVTTGSRVGIWTAACGVLIALTAIVCASDARGLRNADAVALILGLSLYWIGLLILRAMLNRSVSLHMLVCYSHSKVDPSIDDRIADRLDEAVRYRLIRADSGMYGLSRAGVALDQVVAKLYRTFGIH
jgi:hypothetical protein